MKLTLEQLQIGQQLITKVNYKLAKPDIYNNNKLKYSRSLLIIDINENNVECLGDNISLTVIGINKNNIKVKLNKTISAINQYLEPLYYISKETEFTFTFGELKRCCIEIHSKLQTPKDIIQYKIFNNNNELFIQRYFKTIESIKIYLLNRIDFFSDDEFHYYSKNNPVDCRYEDSKLKGIKDKYKKEDIINLNIFSFKNHKIDKKIEFDFNSFYEENYTYKYHIYKYGYYIKSCFQHLKTKNYKYIVGYESLKYLEIFNNNQSYLRIYALKELKIRPEIITHIINNNITDYHIIERIGRAGILLNDINDVFKLCGSLPIKQTKIFIIKNNDIIFDEKKRLIKIQSII